MGCLVRLTSAVAQIHIRELVLPNRDESSLVTHRLWGGGGEVLLLSTLVSGREAPVDLWCVRYASENRSCRRPYKAICVQTRQRPALRSSYGL